MITVTVEKLKIGERVYIYTDGEGNILDVEQPAIIIRESNYEEYLKMCGKLDPRVKGIRYYYEVSTD